MASKNAPFRRITHNLQHQAAEENSVKSRPHFLPEWDVDTGNNKISTASMGPSAEENK